jgi:hypothetical protein
MQSLSRYLVLQVWQLRLVEYMLFIGYENGFLEKIKMVIVICYEKLHD